MKDQKLPSDTLAKRTSPAKVAIIAIAAVVLVGGLGTAAFALGPSLRAGLNPPTPTATAAPVDTPLEPLTSSEQDTIQQAANDQQATIAADAAAQAAADAAAAAAAAPQTVEAGAPGSRVPFIKSNDPNNANGGDYEDPGLYCQSHSASGNPPVCD